MDIERAKQIWKSKRNIEVLYQDLPVWIEKVNNNITVEVTDMITKERMEVPAYLLIENSPVES